MQNIQNQLLMPHNLTEEETYEGSVPHKDKEGESYNMIVLFHTAPDSIASARTSEQRQLYGPGCLNQPVAKVQAILYGHEATLHG
jgi:Icc-related predicted phosphoesterase